MSLHDVTLVVTSCGRPDLLFRTLESLDANEPYSFAARIIVEDSADAKVAKAIRARYPDAIVLLNDPQIGQMRAIDRAYAEVQTPYVLHCEDDWSFDGGAFVDRGIAVLDTVPDVSTVCVRHLDDMPQTYLKTAERMTVADVAIATIALNAHPEWFGYGFNPSLLRMETYATHGPFGPFQTEAAISLHFKQHGFTTAYLDPGHARHIGDGAHVVDPFQPKRPTGLVSRLRHSVSKRLARLGRKLGG